MPCNHYKQEINFLGEQGFPISTFNQLHAPKRHAMLLNCNETWKMKVETVIIVNFNKQINGCDRFLEIYP